MRTRYFGALNESIRLFGLALFTRRNRYRIRFGTSWGHEHCESFEALKTVRSAVEDPTVQASNGRADLQQGLKDKLHGSTKRASQLSAETERYNAALGALSDLWSMPASDVGIPGTAKERVRQ